MLPLFVLNSVLLPGCTLDLQVFEARYLDMLSRCLRQGTHFGVLGLDSEAEGEQVLYGCEAHIIDWQQLESGLLGIRVLGTRVFVVDELSQQHDGLNVGRVSWLSRVHDAELAPEHLELALVLEALLLHPHVQAMDLPKMPLTQHLLADRLSYLLPLSIAEKTAQLSLLDADQRLQALQAWLAAMQA